MSSVNLNIRTEKDVKVISEKIFGALGLNMTTAVNMFLRQVIQENGLPFEVKLNAPIKISPDEIEDADNASGNSLKEFFDPKDAWVFDMESEE